MAQPAPRSKPVEAVADTERRPTPDLADGTRDRLAAHFAFRQPDEVADYLRRYPHLVPLLFEAAEVIPRYFGADAPLVLEVVTDPEEDDPIPALFALIQTALDSDEARERMDRLDDDWWLDASPDGLGVLVVDVEFV